MKKNQIKIKFFGILKEIFNTEIVINLNEETTIRILKKNICNKITDKNLIYLKDILIKSTFSNKKHILNDNYIIKNNDIIHVLPPFSGG